MLGAVEPVDGPVRAAWIGGTEHLHPEVTRELPCGSDESLEDLLVGLLVSRLDPPGDGGGDGTTAVGWSRPVRAHASSHSLNWSRPTLLPQGSMNHAASAKPTSATPSTVFSHSSSYSRISTPRERSSATSAAISSTRQDALVCSSVVPVALLVTASRLSPPHLNVTKSSDSSNT